MRGLFNATRRLLGGGTLHPDAYKGGRKPGQVLPTSVAQITFHEWEGIIYALVMCIFPATIWYNKHYVLRESCWVDNHYDRCSPYEREWAKEHVDNKPLWARIW